MQPWERPELTRRSRKLESLTDAPKYVAFGDSTGVALVNGGSQSGEFRFVLLFLAFQGSQSGADYFGGIFIASGLDLLGHEAVKLIG
jgi:hypothetical protein